ncbi:MAG: DUF2256 domain-containing protein [Tabrizicola sp.]
MPGARQFWRAGKAGVRMPKMRKKSDLPQKLCAACGLPFSWRKKWERDWEAVRFCSDRCRKAGVKGKEGTTPR